MAAAPHVLLAFIFAARARNAALRFFRASCSPVPGEAFFASFTCVAIESSRPTRAQHSWSPPIDFVARWRSEARNETHHTRRHVRKPCVKSQKAGTHLGIVCIAASLLNSK